MSAPRVNLSTAAAMLMFGAAAQAGAVVSPPQYENAEAPDNSQSWPPTSRAMGIYDSSHFAAFPPGGANIVEKSLRPDGSSPVGEQMGFGGVQIFLSVTTVAPNQMSNTFADNIRGELVEVYNGPWSPTAVNGDPPGPQTRPFDYRFEFSEPFFYNPAAGHLLVDWRFETPASPQGTFDISFNRDTGQAIFWTGNLGANSPVADGGPFSVVTQFTFDPEPPGVPGDVNGDEVVDINDYEIIRGNFLTGASLSEGDLNRDGEVDLTDFRIWRIAAFPAAAVPEPSAVSLLAFGIALCWVVRRPYRILTVGW